METRPLTSRALTSTMDTLRPYLADTSVLDVFAGAGRFGIQAAKEGAAQVTFVELDRPALNAIKSESAHGSVPKHCRFRFIRADAMDVPKELKGEKFDIVFADPPFPMWKDDFSNKLLTHLVNWLGGNSILLVKHPFKVVLSSPVLSLKIWKNTVFGESGLTYFRYEEKTG